jgi:hypothetical protein
MQEWNRMSEITFGTTAEMGVAALPNYYGVWVAVGAQRNTIGGTSAGQETSSPTTPAKASL